MKKRTQVALSLAMLAGAKSALDLMTDAAPKQETPERRDRLRLKRAERLKARARPSAVIVASRPGHRYVDSVRREKGRTYPTLIHARDCERCAMER